MTHIRRKKVIAIAGSFIFVAIFLIMAMQPATATATREIQPAVSVAQPIPYENTKITWSTYNSSMARNEYLNGTNSPNYINAEPSIFYKNYISINPEDIRTDLTYPTYANTSKAYAVAWTGYGATSNANDTFTLTKKANNIYFNATSNANDEFHTGIGFNILFSNMPSEDLAYDWITMQYRVSGASITGETAQAVQGYNNISTISMQQLNGTGSGIISYSLEQAYEENHFLSKANYLKYYVEPMVILNMPKTTSPETVSLELTGMYITTYPITLGSNEKGATIYGGINSIELSNFHPDISNIKVINNGYSEALSMPIIMAQNYDETQNQISTGNYIEETTTQASFEFPTGTDISYSGTNISMALNGINGKQIPVIDINGVSYTNKISNMTGNKTFYAGPVNPNQPNNIIYQVYYTASQWNSITSPPFFLSVQGIEYYWWVFLIGTFGAIGIFAGVKSYAEGKEENLRMPPKVR